MQGVSLCPAFEGKTLDRKEPIFWEHEGNRAVRDGKWKLVAKDNQPWELYDMETDRTEMNDLAAKYPEKVKEMADQWDAWAARSDVLPLGTWKKEPDPRTQKRVYKLKQGDEIPREKGPVVSERDVLITAEILEFVPDGVIIAQGGLLHGYTLYLSNGYINFAIRRDGELTTIAAKEPLPPGPTVIVAKIEKEGSIRILLDGQELALSETGGPLLITPIDQLSVGQDSGDPVGNYTGPFAFKGKLGSITVDTRPDKKMK
jgi:arylsulfatase